MRSGSLRTSAVLMLLFPVDGEDHIIFTRRTEGVKTHKGQISLPGGQWEPSDGSLLETALRETEEELGIPRADIQVIGRLPDVFTVVSNFIITPFVGRLKGRPSYRTDPVEVAAVIEVPESRIREPEIYWTEQREGPEGSREIHFFKYGETIIWGATAKILREFLDNGFTALPLDQ